MIKTSEMTVEVSKRFLIDALYVWPYIELPRPTKPQESKNGKSKIVTTEIIDPRKAYPLRPFQKNAVERMREIPDWTLLFDDMGLGKTRQVLESIQADNLKPCLLVPPKGLALNWQAEIMKWYPEELEPVVYDGRTAEFVKTFLDSVAAGEKRFFLIWHDVLSKSPLEKVVKPGTRAIRNKKFDPYITVIERLPWKSIVVDEAHRFRNDDAARTRGLLRLGKSTDAKKYVLTGTPIVNSAVDLWPLLKFVGANVETREQFENEFTFRTKTGKPRGFKNRSRFMEFVGDRWIRRTKAQVLKQLPPKTIVELPLELEEKQRKVYDEMFKNLAVKLPNGKQFKVSSGDFEILALLLRLRQITLDPRLIGSDAPSAKTKAVIELIEDSGGQCVVYSNFREYVKLIRSDLETRGIKSSQITGADSMEHRKGAEQRFQDGHVQVLAATMDAAGEGINLTAATTAIVVDQWWHSKRAEQAIDRSHRIGTSKPLDAYLLKAQKTIDEQIFQTVKRKEADSSAVLDALVEHLTKTDEGKELLERLTAE